MNDRLINIKPANSESVAAVSLKLPEFYTHNPDLWFLYCEQQFLLRNIKDDQTKFAHAVVSLPNQVVERVMSSISNPPVAGKYNALKSELLRVFTLTGPEWAAQSLNMPGLGDQCL